MAEEDWVIEKIIKHKKKQGVEYFLVKWEDYDDDYNSWCTAEEIGDNYFIEEYFNRRSEIAIPTAKQEVEPDIDIPLWDEDEEYNVKERLRENNKVSQIEESKEGSWVPSLRTLAVRTVGHNIDLFDLQGVPAPLRYRVFQFLQKNNLLNDERLISLLDENQNSLDLTQVGYRSELLSFDFLIQLPDLCPHLTLLKLVLNNCTWKWVQVPDDSNSQEKSKIIEPQAAAQNKEVLEKKEQTKEENEEEQKKNEGKEEAQEEKEPKTVLKHMKPSEALSEIFNAFLKFDKLEKLQLEIPYSSQKIDHSFFLKNLKKGQLTFLKLSNFSWNYTQLDELSQVLVQGAPLALQTVSFHQMKIPHFWPCLLIWLAPQLEKMEFVQVNMNRQAFNTTFKKVASGKNLKTVIFDSTQFYQDMFTENMSFPSVENLCLPKIPMSNDIFWYFPGTRNLTFSGDNSEFSLIKRFKALRSLTITGTLSRTFFSALRTLPPKIKTISLKNTIWIENPFTHVQTRPDIIGTYTGVAELDLTNAPWAGDVFLGIVLPKAFPNLKVLSLSEKAKLLDKTIEAINQMKHCTIARVK